MITICDFEDSFTFNIFSDLVNDFETKVLPFKEIKSFLKSKKDSKKKEVIILGPGPGHPSEYSFLDLEIKNLLSNKNILIFGICLGHQLIWKTLGVTTSKSSNPVHGQIEQLENNNNFFNQAQFNKILNVQRYNSLSVELSDQMTQDLVDDGWKLILKNNELYASSKNNIITYQFHPESVGTYCRGQYYGPVYQFLL
jgi:anthranilate/para-aminobenzoate synthase component II